MLLSVVFIIVVAIVHSLFPTGFVGLLIGAASSLLMGFGKTGRNAANANDYIIMNKRYFLVDEMTVRSLI